MGMGTSNEQRVARLGVSVFDLWVTNGRWDGSRNFQGGPTSVARVAQLTPVQLTWRGLWQERKKQLNRNKTDVNLELARISFRNENTQ